MFFSCPNCENIFGLESESSGTWYCPRCGFYSSINTVNSNASTADINNITIHTKAANVDKRFYYSTEKYPKNQFAQRK